MINFKVKINDENFIYIFKFLIKGLCCNYIGVFNKIFNCKFESLIYYKNIMELIDIYI